MAELPHAPRGQWVARRMRSPVGKNRLLPQNQQIRGEGNGLADRASLLSALCATEALRNLSDVELVHLVFQRAQWNSKVLCGPCYVSSAFLESPQDEIPLEG